ncbi:MAG: UDP-3-O-(3-hydroxymyristoyl)glucosamine N-acyltransferase [Pirellulales bacterium]|nr:UDP-3-O-(3-hydroxymyristoyl)glucosamine N-acyltransferase [Pirellulales bacterium]
MADTRHALRGNDDPRGPAGESGMTMIVTLSHLAEITGGELRGDSTASAIAITGAATLETASTGHITLVDTADKALRLPQCAASAVLVPANLTLTPLNIPVIAVADVHAAFAKIVQHFRPRRAPPSRGISPAAHISPTARIAPDVTVHPLALIGDDVELEAGVIVHSGAKIMAGCRIGAGTVIFSNAVLYEETLVGPRCIIHAGAILGAYGFGYKLVNGRHCLSAQLGYVILESDVEVGANTTIDRGTYGPTIIGEGTKIDNLVMIAHNCRLGKHNMICSQVGIAGSTTTGDYVVMAGQVGVRDHVHIGTGAKLGAMAGVANDVPEHTHMLGAPAIPEREQKLQFAALSKLPEMRKELKQLRLVVASLQQAAAGTDHNPNSPASLPLNTNPTEQRAA